MREHASTWQTSSRHNLPFSPPPIQASPAPHRTQVHQLTRQTPLSEDEDYLYKNPRARTTPAEEDVETTSPTRTVKTRRTRNLRVVVQRVVVQDPSRREGVTISTICMVRLMAHEIHCQVRSVRRTVVAHHRRRPRRMVLAVARWPVMAPRLHTPMVAHYPRLGQNRAHSMVMIENK